MAYLHDDGNLGRPFKVPPGSFDSDGWYEVDADKCDDAERLIADLGRRLVGDRVEALWRQCHTDSATCPGCSVYGKHEHEAGLAATVIVARFLAGGGRRSLLSCLVNP